MRLRSANQYDLDFMLYTLEKLNKKYFESHLGKWDLVMQKEFLQKSMQKEKYNIIYEDEEQAGIFAWNETENKIYLYELLLTQKFQNKGIGKMLLDMLKKRGDYFKKPVYAYVFKSNKRALDFYINNGFIVDSDDRSHIKVKYLESIN